MFGDGFFVDVCGMSNTAWQPGHFPFLPADDAGVLTKRLHCGQLNAIDPVGAADFVLVAGLAFWLPATAPDRLVLSDVFLSDVLGMGMTAAHLGHFPFLPPTFSGTVML